jgi:serine/threonine protein kinase
MAAGTAVFCAPGLRWYTLGTPGEAAGGAPHQHRIENLMSHAADTLTHMEASLVWERLSEHIDRFAEAWKAADAPPEVAGFLPAGPPTLRRLTLVEAIKVDMEQRWQGRRWPKQVEEYLEEFPELAADGGIPCDLVYEEYHVRRQQGDTVTPAEYCQRFPERAGELKRLLDIDAPTQSTVMVAAKRLPEFEVGQMVDDFELVAPLGKGAFASVFRARQVSMHRTVALKISRDRSAEPQTLAQLEHPNIVRVFDQRVLGDQKLRLLYMQYIPGGTLHDVLDYLRSAAIRPEDGAPFLAAIDQALARNGEEPPADSMTRFKLAGASWPQVVCWIGSRLAGALAHAHAQGILHRDIKPANVLVGADAQPRLADFNISCSKLDGVTPAAYFGGTLAYMSPEQLEAYNPAHERRPDQIDARADVYSLGLVLWELLTLVRPFSDVAMPHDWSLTLEAMTALRREGLPPEDRARAPSNCPRMVVDVLLKCLEPNPENRHASAAELARELDLCLQPRAHSLLHVGRDVRSLAKRHPVTTTVLVGVLPNIVLSALSVGYNWSEIIRRLGPEAQELFFGSQILAVNSIAYTIGLGYVLTTRWRLFGTLARLVRGEKVDPPPSIDLVRRCLKLGAATAGISALLWTISGFVFPAWLRFGTGQISREAFIHFVVSQLLCGLIAATQSYYVVTFLSIRLCYPWLLRARPADARELPELARLAGLGRIVLALTVAVPFLALAALLLNDVSKPVIGAIAATGFFGLALAYYLDLAIRADLAALAVAINPGRDALLAGDSADSLLSGSRR